MAAVGAAGAESPAGLGDGRASPDAKAGATPDAGTAAGGLAEDAVDVGMPAEFARFPALARAVETAALRHRQSFQEDAAAALARGEDVSGWRLRIAWRVILGNRYLRVAQGDGTRLQAGTTTPITERFTYDGVSGEVLALDDWFDDPAVWPVIAGLERGASPATLATSGAPTAVGPARVGADLSGTGGPTYEPVFSADGPVMGFDLLYPAGRIAPAAAGVRRVRIPIGTVAPYLGDAHRASLAAMAGSG